MSETERTARTVVVHGQVQGVFFRDSCRSEASAAGVGGWVTNQDDGTVRALFEGPIDAVERMVAWARQGPDGASVSTVEVSDAEPQGRTDFEVR